MADKYRFDKENHIHLLNELPLVGTSSMASVLAKPLTWWASGLAVSELGWTHKGTKEKGFVKKEKRIIEASKRRKEISSFTDEEYLKLLDDAYAAHSKKLTSSAKDGTDMHALMEDYVKHCIDKNNGVPDEKYKTDNEQVKILVKWSLEKVKRFLWSEGHCYSKELWLGGISDVGFEDKQGNYAILDFKSSKDVYTSQFWQCIGYAKQIEENGVFDSDGNLLLTLDKEFSYVAVLPFGMTKPEVKYYFDMDGGLKACRAMVLLYGMLNK